MSQAKYSGNQHPISIVLAWIAQGGIAIPEIQRPFVWSKTQVRDLMDSLLRGLLRIRSCRRCAPRNSFPVYS